MALGLNTFPFRQAAIMIWIWGLFATVAAASVEDLVGTWTTKSREVITGPVCFFDPESRTNTDSK